MYSQVAKLCKICKGEPYLSEYTTFGIGGRCEVLAFPEKIEELLNLIEWANKNSCPLTIMGAGSNILVGDSGLNGLVVSTRKMSSIYDKGDFIRCDCGVKLPVLSSYALDNSLQGYEFCVGIPATLGGAVVMNAGAFGGDMSSVVISATLLRGGSIQTLSLDELGFNYRKSNILPTDVILTVDLKKEEGNLSKIREIREKNILKRTQSQPQGKSAGCVFRAVDGVSAGYYIDKAGLKGRRVGGAKISEKHAGFIINEGKASCNDVKMLISLVKEEVYKKFGINLQTEILIWEKR